jgi:surface antigen
MREMTSDPSRPDWAGVDAAVPSGGPAGGRVRRALAAVALVAGVAGLSGATIAIDAPIASAAGTLPAAPSISEPDPPLPKPPPAAASEVLCAGYSQCNSGPYTTYNYQNEQNTLYWPDTGSDLVECTNFAAYVESEVYGVATPTYGLGVATDWAGNAADHGVTVNQTPTVGSVAQWYANDQDIGGDGHVAIVQQVGPNDSYIIVSQDNWTVGSGKPTVVWMKIYDGELNPAQGEPWPDSFIHFSGTRFPSTVSDTQPSRLIQSTGNLYWTVNQTVGETGYAYLYRTSKDSQPGDERVLYQQSGSGDSAPDFGAITYANVGGTWYGYMVVNYLYASESQIVRVPLAGGPAVVLATAQPYIGNADLVTDGSSLYWADSVDVFAMPINGGQIHTLASGDGISQLGLDGQTLYYNSDDQILTIPTSGGQSTIVVTATYPITALYPPSATNEHLYWGEDDGSVYSGEPGGSITVEADRPVGGPGPVVPPTPAPTEDVSQLQAPTTGASVSSVSVAGNHIVWGECLLQGCKIVGDDNGDIMSVVTSGPSVDVQGDASGWYWGDFDLEKFTV